MFNLYATQFLLEVNANQPIAGFGEKLAYGGKMLVVGMGVVFSVLILLWGALSVFNLVFGTMAKKPAAKKAEPAKKQAEPTPVATPVTTEEDPTEIIAVIAAAIAAASADKPGAKFKVVSFKRK